MNYYQATRNSFEALPVLHEEVQADICVVGAGFTGLGVALELLNKGYSVIVLEAQTVGFGASGRSGGQIASGFSPGMVAIDEMLGGSVAKSLWTFSENSKEILKSRIQKYGIECDLREGELYVAPKPSHSEWLQQEKKYCEDHFGYDGYSWVDKEDLCGLIASKRYIAGLHDREGGHLHPLNYTLGLAEAVLAAGGTIFENSAALSVDKGKQVRVYTKEGAVQASTLVLAGNAYLDAFDLGQRKNILCVGSGILATEPLGEERAKKLISTTACICDTYFDLDYFKITPDTRLVFGGQDMALFPFSEGRDRIKRNMLRTFPSLEGIKIDFSWTGKIAATRKLLPEIKRLEPNVYVVHGYSGQGVVLSAVASQIVAEAIDGDLARLDVFENIHHAAIPQNKMLINPIIYTKLLWEKIKDAL
ncbi:NAD(P)/FAD-dependent oxidoreductase [Sneathiella aquimaris]|uniref:NAD(P)/FAD-dependent oxidoreductase n=1 Tax=Sneathiella aquimaris TaxID=2599305 RepID=UPI00146DBD00|nr:FAD-binding oxidoreductase [Sneathiella aquimaris]